MAPAPVLPGTKTLDFLLKAPKDVLDLTSRQFTEAIGLFQSHVNTFTRSLEIPTLVTPPTPAAVRPPAAPAPTPTPTPAPAGGSIPMDAANKIVEQVTPVGAPYVKEAFTRAGISYEREKEPLRRFVVERVATDADPSDLDDLRSGIEDRVRRASDVFTLLMNSGILGYVSAKLPANYDAFRSVWTEQAFQTNFIRSVTAELQRIYIAPPVPPRVPRRPVRTRPYGML